MPESNFSKTLLQSYVITNCKRRLFLELGKAKPELWFDPVRSVPSKPPERLIIQRDFLVKNGKKFEKRVYQNLISLKNVIYKVDKDGNVSNSYITRNTLLQYFDLINKNQTEAFLLLEFEYGIPESFFSNIFPPKSGGNTIPINYSELRPDIILVGNSVNKFLEEVIELTHEGKFQKLNQADLKKRIGISIFDIKFVQDEHVSKKHFLEIHYYLLTLATKIKELNLQDKFYIRANLNGIFPNPGKKRLEDIHSIDDLFKEGYLNIIKWKEAERIFSKVIKTIKNLWKNTPCPIEDVDLNIHQGCGYCQYIEDCKNTLGMKEGVDPKNWSSRLLPFTSQSIAQQLIEEYDCHTIGDVLKKVDNIKIGSIPKPLYSELPTLKMKAEAIANNRTVIPSEGRTQSFAIPRYSPISINFDVEYDRNHDKIFAIGIYLKIFIHSKLNYHAIFDNWWRVWKSALKKNLKPELIKKELNQYLIREVPLEIVERFLEDLKVLKKVKIFIRGEKSKEGTSVHYSFARVNKTVEEDSEAKLIVNAILRFNRILDICNILEDYIVIDNQYGYYGPDTSIFYWSRNQLDHFQNMMERHLDYILDKRRAREAYQSILMYFTPSDSEVSHPYQHKKLFDVQAFVDSFIGFPDIINYTWHGIAKIVFNFYRKRIFWNPHFNFLDLTNWLKYLSENDKSKKLKLEKDIKNQILIKLTYINRIREHFQREARHTISKNARVVSKSKYGSAILPYHYHDIAHVWYLFSKLNNALQQQDDEYYRTIFPQFSIGKLFSARVSNLKQHDSSGKTLYYSFETVNLSSNMKLKEGDAVLLIPNLKRGMKLDRNVFKWQMYIQKIIWENKINGNIINTKPTYSNLFERCEEEGIDPKSQPWYLYPLSSDNWSNKLHNSKKIGLFEKNGFGTSWLGFRLAYLWGIRTKPTLLWPPKWDFETPVIYYYAPELLMNLNTTTQTELFTNIFPIPDKSQEDAILNSMNHIISGILGPPGTGKSQTVAALIDEFITRKRKQKKPFKILVTSFSYAALRVVIEKIRMSKTINGDKTNSSQTQMIFLHSETQDPIEVKSGCRDVEDLMRSGGTWKLNGKSRTVTPTSLLEESLEESFILFANAHHLYYLHERVKENFAFDLICVDEASQLPTDYFMSSLQYIHNFRIPLFKPKNLDVTFNNEVIDKKDISGLQINRSELKFGFKDLTKVVIVGDHNQLPPVRVKNPPKNLELILDSLFSYYINGHNISNKQLKVNYRSHRDIVSYTSLLGLYKDLKPHPLNAEKVLEGNLDNVNVDWVKEVLSPEKVVCSLIHNRRFEIGISEFEAKLVCEIISGYFNMVNPRNIKEERRFWSERIGVVAPHNAQGRAIIRKVYSKFQNKSFLSDVRLMEYLKSTIYSVEKFQGSDRDLIISSIGLSDEDKINKEEDFIFDLNRFNVLTSRAKNKILFISSNKFLQYIPEDRKALENASKIYLFVEDFCNESKNLTVKNEKDEEEEIIFKYKN